MQTSINSDCRETPKNKAIDPSAKQIPSPGRSAFAKAAFEDSLNGRIAITPGELAALFGRHMTWGYRQVYAGRVKVIRGAGRILIPLQEIERFVSDTVVYGEADDSSSKLNNNRLQ